jgi:hypothetical protein
MEKACDLHTGTGSSCSPGRKRRGLPSPSRGEKADWHNSASSTFLSGELAATSTHGMISKPRDDRHPGLLELSNQMAAEFRRAELRKYWLRRHVPITPSPEPPLCPEERLINPKRKDCPCPFKMKAKYAKHGQRQLENLPDSATKNMHNADVLVFGDKVHWTTSWLTERVDYFRK